MEFQPRLIDVATSGQAVGNVLVLHGGANRSGPMRVNPTQLSVVRMVPVARRIARTGKGNLNVARLLNSTRGWDSHHSPVDDVVWALEQLADRPGGALPTCLVGHSLGGRAALFAGSQPAVKSVVALAPWVYPNDAPSGLAGREILVIHGTEDRVASSQRSAAVAKRLREQTNVTYLTVEGGKHAMLRYHDEFTEPAAEFAVRTLSANA